MSTVIYLSNRNVRVVTGTGKNGKVTVTDAYSALAPEGSILNGQVIGEEAFRTFLEAFWSEHHLPRKDVTLVLGLAQAVSSVLRVPRMSHRQLMEYLPREFAAKEVGKNPAYSYVILGQRGELMEVAATMVDRSYLEPHLRRFQELGIQLTSVVTSFLAEILSLGCLSYTGDKTCIVQELNGMDLIQMLYVDGDYFQFNAVRVFGQRGTPAFGIECARSINNMQQFLRTQNQEAAVTHVYLGGEYQEDDVEISRESILQMDDSLVVEKLYEETGGAISYRAEKQVPFEQVALMTGALLAPKGKSNLLYQYGQNQETVARRRELLRYLVPGGISVAALAGIAVVQAWLWFSSTEVVNRQFDYLSDQATIERVAEYDRLEKENEELALRVGVISKTLDGIHTYPVYRGEVKDAVESCASGVATAKIVRFDRASGAVSVEALSADEEGAHRFVDRLEKLTDLFATVHYEGFQYDERSGLWKAEVQCYLTVPETDQGEVTP